MGAPCQDKGFKPLAKTRGWAPLAKTRGWAPLAKTRGLNPLSSIFFLKCYFCKKCNYWALKLRKCGF